MAESEQGRVDESQKEWNRERTEKLIYEMEKRPELYDTTLKAYSNRDTRKKICDEIGLILGVTGTEINVKVKALRIQYNATKTKLNKAPKSGSGALGKVKVWQYFDQMHFLDQFTNARKSTSNLTQVENNDCEDGEDGVTNSGDVPSPLGDQESQNAETNILPPKRNLEVSGSKPETKKQKTEKLETELLMNSLEFMKQATASRMNTKRQDREDDCDAFGKHVAEELRSMRQNRNEQGVRLAKLKIEQILYEVGSGPTEQDSAAASASYSNMQLGQHGFVNRQVFRPRYVSPGYGSFMNHIHPGYPMDLYGYGNRGFDRPAELRSEAPSQDSSILTDPNQDETYSESGLLNATLNENDNSSYFQM